MVYFFNYLLYIIKFAMKDNNIINHERYSNQCKNLTFKFLRATLNYNALRIIFEHQSRKMVYFITKRTFYQVVHVLQDRLSH